MKIKYYIRLNSTHVKLENVPTIEKLLLKNNNLVLHNIEELKKPPEKRIFYDVFIKYTKWERYEKPLMQYEKVHMSAITILVYGIELMKIRRLDKQFYYECLDCGRKEPKDIAFPDKDINTITCTGCGITRINTYFISSFI